MNDYWNTRIGKEKKAGIELYNAFFENGMKYGRHGLKGNFHAEAESLQQTFINVAKSINNDS